MGDETSLRGCLHRSLPHRDSALGTHPGLFALLRRMRYALYAGALSVLPITLNDG